MGTHLFLSYLILEVVLFSCSVTNFASPMGIDPALSWPNQVRFSQNFQDTFFYLKITFLTRKNLTYKKLKKNENFSNPPPKKKKKKKKKKFFTPPPKKKKKKKKKKK